MSLIKRFKDFFSIETPEEISSKQNDIRRRRANREAAQDLRNKKDVIRKQLLNYSITQFIINDDLTVDVSGDVWLDARDFYRRIPFDFNKVHGNFRCSHNDLRTLEGIPKWIGGGLALNNNKLEELDYFPDYVNGTINLNNNELKHLDINIEGEFSISCDDNPVTIINPKLGRKMRSWKRTPISKLYDVITSDIENLNVYEFLERIEEFDIIRNYKELDLISLNSLYDYYEIKFSDNLIRYRLSYIKEYTIIG